MTIFEQVINRIAKRAEKQDGDYYKENLLYCGKCNSPKERYLAVGEMPETIVRIMCKCEEEADREETKKNKIDQRREGIEESIRELNAIGAARMPRFNFSMCDGVNKALTERMVKYAKNFDQVYDRNIGLLLYGNTGSGKTFFAECIADALIKNGRFALLTSVSELANAMSSNFNENRARILNYIKMVDLLILDDYGTERNTSFMNEQMFDIVDARYVSNRPVIITTNLSPEAMKANSDIYVKRIAERLLESCVAIEVKGETRRVAKANDKIQQLKEILNS